MVSNTRFGLIANKNCAMAKLMSFDEGSFFSGVRASFDLKSMRGRVIDIRSPS